MRAMIDGWGDVVIKMSETSADELRRELEDMSYAEFQDLLEALQSIR